MHVSYLCTELGGVILGVTESGWGRFVTKSLSLIGLILRSCTKLAHYLHIRPSLPTRSVPLFPALGYGTEAVLILPGVAGKTPKRGQWVAPLKCRIQI